MTASTKKTRHYSPRQTTIRNEFSNLKRTVEASARNTDQRIDELIGLQRLMISLLGDLAADIMDMADEAKLPKFKPRVTTERMRDAVAGAPGVGKRRKLSPRRARA